MIDVASLVSLHMSTHLQLAYALAERSSATPWLGRLPVIAGAVAGAMLRQRCGPWCRYRKIYFTHQSASQVGCSGSAARLLRSSPGDTSFGTTCC